MAATPKHPEESIPGPDFIRRLRRAGPRVGESLLAFEMRIASIDRGRALVFATYKESRSLSDMCRMLGITLQNLHSHLVRLGLTKAHIRSLDTKRRAARR